MAIVKNFQAFRKRAHDSVLRRYENASNYLHTLSWLNISICLNITFGIIFLTTGLILLTGREENSTTGWVFFAISLCMLLLGLFLLIIRCMFPTKAAHARPPQRPRRRTRPTRIYDIHPRPHPTSSTQRVQTTPSPRGLVWTTPVSDLEGQTISQFIAQLSFEQSQRSPVSAPPTYAEAISRPTPVQTDSDIGPPPYRPE